MEIFDNYLQVKSNDTFDDSSDVVQLFRRVAGVDMEIDWVELQNVLNTSFQRGKYSRFFYLPMCKLLYRFCMPFDLGSLVLLCSGFNTAIDGSKCFIRMCVCHGIAVSVCNPV